MLMVFDVGEAGYRLANRHDQDVGWIRENTVGFGGLTDEGAALSAAVAGHETLSAYLERVGGRGAVPPPSSGRPKVVRDGAHEWIARGGQQLARLVRPAEELSGDFGVEFVLPSHLKGGGAIGVSQILHNAIREYLDAAASDEASAKGAGSGASAADTDAPAQSLAARSRSQ